MKKFEAIAKHDGSVLCSLRASDWAGFRDYLLIARGNGWAGEIRCFVAGKEVSLDAALAAAYAAEDAYFAKKEQTHKRVRISQGVTRCANTYREVWVRK